MIVALQANLAQLHLVDAFEHARRARHLSFELRWEDSIDHSEVSKVLAVVPGTHTIDQPYIHTILDKFGNLSHIALPMTGDDGLDKKECARRGISFSRVRGYSTHEVAEYAETLALMLRHEVLPKALAMRNGRWCDNPTIEMKAACVGIVGLGAIGMATAARFAARECRLIGWSRSVKEEFTKLGGRQVDLDELFASAEVVLLHLPLVHGEGGTEGIVDAGQIERMEKVDLVNTSRADLIDGDALLSAVLAEQFHGVAIDVYHPEPPFGASNAWGKTCTLDAGRYNLICQPHMGFKKRGPLNRLVDGVLQNIAQFDLNRLQRDDQTIV